MAAHPGSTTPFVGETVVEPGASAAPFVGDTPVEETYNQRRLGKP